jgi:hypothetical protein
MKKALRLKLARLLRDAVADARKLEKTEGFRLDMRVFCDPGPDGCRVCLGGAYAILHLKEPLEHPSYWSLKAQSAAGAVDRLRLGEVIEAGTFLDSDPHASTSDRKTLRAQEIIGRSLKNSARGTRASWSAYLKAARVLES